MSEPVESFGKHTANRARAAAAVLMLLPAAVQAANVRLMSKGLPYSSAAAGGFPDNSYSVSGDGCQIVYTSFSAQVIAGQADGNGGSDVFLFDRCAAKKFLISHVGDQKTTGNKDSFLPKISRDGKVVVFSSLATDLVSGDPGKDVNNGEDLFVYEVATAKVFLISGAADDPVQTGNRPSGAGGDYVLSADGRFVAFSTDASDLSPSFSDGNDQRDVYLKDWAAPAIQLVSHSFGDPDKPGNGWSEKPSLSRDGGTVAFQSDAADLVGNPGDDTIGMDVFVWGGGNAVLASRAGGSDTRSVGSSVNPVISGNQDYVAFESVEKANVFNDLWTDANGRSDIFLFHTIDRTLTLVSHSLGVFTQTADGESVLSWSGVALPSLTDSGSFLAYTSTAPDLATGQSASDRGLPGPDFEDSDVFLYDLSKNESDLLSKSFGAAREADGYSYAPVVSAGSLGRPSVAYVSIARDLVSGQVDANDLFVGDYFLWAAGETALVSHTDGDNLTTAVATTTGSTVALSADAKFVAFGTDAPDIVLGDTNAELDAFAYEASTKKNTLVSEGEVTIIDAGANNISSPTFSAVPYARSSVSGDGNLVAFVSFATNLLTGQVDGNGLGSDVFLYDRSADKVVALVSHAVGAPTTGGNGPSDEPVISRDGAFVAFRSGASNLVTGSDLTGNADIFVYEVATGTVTLVSHAAGLPTTAANGASQRPVVSADGKLVAFVSTSSNLVASQSDLGSDQDVFRWDRANNLNELVSHAAASVVQGAASGGSFEPAISPNGRYVAYTSKATDILTPQVDGAGTDDVFVWDDFDKQNRLVSHQSSPVVNLNAAANGFSDRPSVVQNIPSNSAYVVFRSRATNVVQSQVDTNGIAGDIVLWHNNENRLVSKQPLAPSTTADGESDQPILSDDNKFIAFQTRATNIGLGVSSDVNGSGWDIYVADRAQIEASASTANRLVSHAAGVLTATANSSSSNPSIDSKGDFVAYESSASDLVAGQLSGGGQNLFLWQRGGNVSALLSHKLGDGRTAGNNSPSENSMLAAAAPIVAFSSYASDLVSGDLNGPVLDAFVAEGVFTDLKITKTSSPVATPGAPFTYTIVAENLGPENAPGSTITDDLPFPLDNPPTYTATWTCVGSGGGTCGAASGSSDINQTVDLPVGGQVTFTVMGTLALAPDSGNLVNTATIVGPVADPDVTNNTSTDTDVLTPIANLNLTLTDSPDPVLTGAALTYVATLTNTGPSNAKTTTLTVTVPSTAVFQSFNSPVPGCSFGGVTLTCAFGVVGPGISIPVTISMTAPPGPGPINASANGGSLTSTSVSATATTEVIAPGSATIDTATVTSKYYENTIEWLTPPAATGYVATVIRFSSAGFPATETDGSPLPGGFIEPGAGNKGQAVHNVIDNGVHYYSLFAFNGVTYSSPKQLRARTFDNSPGFPEEPVQWAFTMGITSVTAPTVGSNAIVAVANDRGVYAMQRGSGASSGLWPTTFWPLKLQGIAQNRSPVVNTTVGGASRVVFVGAQDGRVYAIDADSGASGGAGPLWMSGLLGATSPQVQASPAGIFSVFGSGLSEDLILIGSRDATATTNFFYGLKARQPLGGTNQWLFNPGGASPMGIVSGGGAVDYPTKRVWFGSRQKSGGPTLWCLQFDETTVSSCSGSWPITSPNGFDQSPVLRAGKIYIGDNLSDVFCYDAASGTPCGTSAAFDLVPDGPVKGFVFPDRLSGDLYASTTNKVWAWTDTGSGIGFKVGWPGAGLTVIPNPSIPLLARLGGPPYLYVGSSNGRLYQIDTTNPSGSGIKWVELGGGGAVIGAPSLDLANQMVIVGSDNGVIYGVKVPLP